MLKIIVLTSIYTIICNLLIFFLRKLVKFSMGFLTSVNKGIEVCQIVHTNECTEYQDQESVYCCDYIANYQSIYLHLIQIVAYMDMGDLVITTLALLIALTISIFKIGPKGSGIYIMAGSSAITAIVTFSLVGLIKANSLITTASEIYDHACYSRPNMEVIVELKNEFGSIIWVDALNGGIDVIALCILFYGIKFGDPHNDSFAVPTKSIYIVLYIMRMIVSYISYFKAELPAYLDFLHLHQDHDALCYKLHKLGPDHHYLRSSVI